MTVPDPTAPTAEDVIAEVRAERRRQDAKWGEQNHPDGTGRAPHAENWGVADGSSGYIRDRLTQRCQARFEIGVGAWLDILAEEVAEAFAEDDPALLRAELIQVAAVAVSWVEAIDRRPS